MDAPGKIDSDQDFTVGSYGNSFDYGLDDEDLHAYEEERPKIVLMGNRRVGKSSIQKVVFHKMSPNETLFLESTAKPSKEDIASSSFIHFEVWDMPAQINFLDRTVFDPEGFLKNCGALIFVIDSQDELAKHLQTMNKTIVQAHKINPYINFEVFIHKVDGLNDDSKIDIQRQIYQRSNESLIDEGMEQVHLSFYLTSIYDHSIFEAFSKVVQKLIPQLPVLENLLNVFISNSCIEKAFLFDVASKIYVATDSSPVDMQSYELCCDMIDVVIDVASIYGVKKEDSSADEQKEQNSSSVIRLNNGTVLYLKEVNRFLALVCILRSDNFDKQGLIDYNFLCFKKAIQDVFEVRKRLRQEMSPRPVLDSQGDTESHTSADSVR